jgi:hypothetical protein
LLTGCDTPTHEPSAPDASEASAPATSRRAEPATDYTATRPRKGEILGGERVSRTITWPSPDASGDASGDEGGTALDEGARDRLSAPAKVALRSAPVPVLVPDEGTDRGELFVGDTWYAFSTKIPGASISVQGSAQARVHGHIGHADPTQTVRGHGGFVSSNESIWSVSWIEHGAAYSLELSCDDPRASICATPDRAMALAEAMVYVGGKEVL